MNEEELKKYLEEFWLLDINEYSILKDLIKDEMEKYRGYIRDLEKNDGVEALKDIEGFLSEDSDGREILRSYYNNQRMLEFYTIMKEKVDYIISKGLCKHN